MGDTVIHHVTNTKSLKREAVLGRNPSIRSENDAMRGIRLYINFSNEQPLKL